MSILVLLIACVGEGLNLLSGLSPLSVVTMLEVEVGRGVQDMVSSSV